MFFFFNKERLFFTGESEAFVLIFFRVFLGCLKKDIFFRIMGFRFFLWVE